MGGLKPQPGAQLATTHRSVAKPAVPVAMQTGRHGAKGPPDRRSEKSLQSLESARWEASGSRKQKGQGEKQPWTRGFPGQGEGTQARKHRARGKSHKTSAMAGIHEGDVEKDGSWHRSKGRRASVRARACAGCGKLPPGLCFHEPQAKHCQAGLMFLFP